MQIKKFILFLLTILAFSITQMRAAEIPEKLIGPGKWVTLKTGNGYYLCAIKENGNYVLGQSNKAPTTSNYAAYCWQITGDATEGYKFHCLGYMDYNAGFDYSKASDPQVELFITNPATIATNYQEVRLTEEGSEYFYTDKYHQLQLKGNTDMYLAYYSVNYHTIRLHNSANYGGSQITIGGIYEWSVAAVVYGTETEDGEGHPEGAYLPKGGVTYGGVNYTHGSSLYVGDVSSGFSIIDLKSDGFEKATIKIDEKNKYIVAYYVGSQSGINYKTATLGGPNAVTGEDKTIWQLDPKNYITNTSGNYTTVPAGKAWQMEMVVENTNTSGSTPDASFNRWGSCILSSCGDPLNTYYWGDFQVYQHAPTHSNPNTLNFKSNKADGNDHIIAEGHSVEHQNYKVIVRYNGEKIYLIRTIILNNDLTETNTVYNNVWVAAQQQKEISQMSCALPTGINLKSLKISIAEESNLMEDVDYAIQNITNNDYLTGVKSVEDEWHAPWAGDAAKYQIEWTRIQDLTYTEVDGGLHNSFYIKLIDNEGNPKYLGPGNTNVDTKEAAQPYIYTTNKKVQPIDKETKQLGTAWMIDTEANNTWNFDFFANFYVEVSGNNSGGLTYRKNGNQQTATNNQYIELPSGVLTTQMANSSQAGYMAAISKHDIRLQVQYTPLENTFYNITNKSNSSTSLFYWNKSSNKLVTYSTTNSQSGIDVEWGEKGNCAEYTITKATEIPMKMSQIGEKYYNTVYCPNALTLPAGVKAYRLKEVTDGKFIIKEVELTNNVLPANSPVVLISDAAVAAGNWAISTNATTPIADNKFLGVFEQTTNPGAGQGTESNVFILGNKSGIGFYHYTAAMIPAFKVYYVDETAQALYVPQNSTKMFAINFDEEEVTPVSEVEEDNIVRDNAEIYDLTGRRVSTLKKSGLYIINGKKVLVK